MRSKTPPSTHAAAATLCFVAAYLCIALFGPKFTDREDAKSIPYRETNAPPGDYAMHSTVTVGPFASSTWVLSVDDCLQSLRIDGVPQNIPTPPYCDYQKPLRLELPALTPGQHDVEATVSNAGGGAVFSLTGSWSMPGLFIVLAGLCAAAWCVRRELRDSATRAVTVVLLLGMAFLTIAVLGTPMGVRGHDTEGHIEYVDQLMANRRLPAEGEGWEWYQPPLYYAVLSPLRLASTHLRQPELSDRLLQLPALLCGFAWLWLLAAALKQWNVRGAAAAMSLACVALLPTTAFAAARVNNDSLALPLSAAALLVAGMWWKKPTYRSLLLCSVLLSLALLAKGTALLLVPIIGALLLLKPKLRVPAKLKAIGIAFVTVALLAGWYGVLRVGIQRQNEIVGNVGNMNSALRVETTPEALLTFRPWKILQETQARPFDQNRDHVRFWEYFWRTGLLGEFDQTPFVRVIAPWLAAMSLLLLFPVLYGVWRMLLRRREHLPLLLTLIILPLGHLAARIRYPFTSTQDFRYSVLILFPVVVALGLALQHLPKAPRRITAAIAGVFCVLGFVCTVSLLQY